MRNQDIEFLKKVNLPIYIWGSGDVGKESRKALNREGFSVKKYVVDDVEDLPKDTISKEILCSTESAYVLVKGFLSAYYISEDEIKHTWPGCEYVMSFSDIYEPDTTEILEASYYDSHKSEFGELRSDFADDLSVKSFDAFIKSKLTKTNEDMLSIVEPTQYFFENAPWQYKDTEVLLDGGAFNGDSILDFIKLRHEDYKKIIAFEPDEHNYDMLLQNMKLHSVENVEALRCGMYKEKTTLRFLSSGDMESLISEQGDMEIEVDTIDGVADDEEVSIIKMDLEGSEMDALEGAKKTIVRCRPILMISAYHKQDDMLNIYHFVKSLVENYSFFFRCHKPITIDAVLYAVPNERLR